MFFAFLCQTWTGTIFVFLQKITQAVFFADLRRTWPDTILLQEHQLHIFFRGDITDMVFLLIVQDLTWYNKQKHHYNM